MRAAVVDAPGGPPGCCGCATCPDELTAFHSSTIGGASGSTSCQEIVDLVQEGRVHANVDRTFTLDEIAAAHAYMEANRAVGKVIGIP